MHERVREKVRERARARVRVNVSACGLSDLCVGRVPGILYLVFAFLPPSFFGLHV